MGETLIIRNSAGFHLQGGVTVQQDSVVFCHCTTLTSLKKNKNKTKQKPFSEATVETVLSFISVGVIYMIQRQQSSSVITIMCEIPSCHLVVVYLISIIHNAIITKIQNTQYFPSKHNFYKFYRLTNFYDKYNF